VRILLAGDTHGNIKHVRYLIRMAAQRGISIVFVVGDFGAWEHAAKGVRFFDDVDGAAKAAGVTVFFLDGNHDKTSLVLEKYGDCVDSEGFLICRPNLRYAPRGHRWTWGSKRFLAFGGAYSVDKFMRLDEEHQAHKLALELRNSGLRYVNVDASGTLWFPEEEASDEEFERVLRDRTRVDVLLTHDKPDGSTPPGWTYKQPVECYRNQVRIQQIADLVTPTLLVHGHLHYPYEQDVRLAPSGATMRVIGLDCDQPMFHPDYDPMDSWVVLDLDLFDVSASYPEASVGGPRRLWSGLSSAIGGPYGVAHLAA
jgi:predicted phosphodiesterase